MALNLSADYLFVDDPLTVSYAVKTAEGEWAAGVSVPYVQRVAPTLEDFKSNPAVQKTAAVFHLWAANLGGIAPKMGDTLTSAGAVWVVRSVGPMDRDANGVQRYRCLCVAQLV